MLIHLIADQKTHFMLNFLGLSNQYNEIQSSPTLGFQAGQLCAWLITVLLFFLCRAFLLFLGCVCIYMVVQSTMGTCLCKCSVLATCTESCLRGILPVERAMACNPSEYQPTEILPLPYQTSSRD